MTNDLDVYTRLRNLGLLVRWSNNTPLYHPHHPQTNVVAPQFAPQHEVIQTRGRELATVCYQGLDPARNTPAPAWVDEAAAWLKTQKMSLKDRAVNKFLKHMGQLTAAKVEQAPFQEEAA